MGKKHKKLTFYYFWLTYISAAKSLVFIRAYSYIRVFEEKYSYFTRIFVIYSYFLWLRAHSTRCELFEAVKSYFINLWLQIHGKVLQSWNNQKNMLNFELHRSTMNSADLRTFVVKMSRVEFTRFFKTKTLILLVFLLVFYSYFCLKSARILLVFSKKWARMKNLPHWLRDILSQLFRVNLAVF